MRLDPTDGGGVTGRRLWSSTKSGVNIIHIPGVDRQKEVQSYGVEDVALHPKIVMLSLRGAACGSDPAWQPTISAYTTADTDNQLRSYYQTWQANPKRPFTNTLAKSFGSGPTGFMCGIGLQGSCGSQIGCDGRWTYTAPVLTNSD